MMYCPPAISGHRSHATNIGDSRLQGDLRNSLLVLGDARIRVKIKLDRGSVIEAKSRRW